MMPPCETPTGCPVPDADDPMIERFCQDYLKAKALFAYTKDHRSYAAIFDRWELYESPQTLFELEEVYFEWINAKHQRE
jgi:hypothetical protein